jgi:hypothetical protein
LVFADKRSRSARKSTAASLVRGSTLLKVGVHGLAERIGDVDRLDRGTTYLPSATTHGVHVAVASRLVQLQQKDASDARNLADAAKPGFVKVFDG